MSSPISSKSEINTNSLLTLARFLFSREEYLSSRAVYKALSLNRPIIYNANIKICEQRIAAQRLRMKSKSLISIHCKEYSEDVFEKLIGASRILKYASLPEEESDLLEYALAYDPEGTRIIKILFDALNRSRRYQRASEIIESLEDKLLTAPMAEWAAKVKVAFAQRQPDILFSRELISDIPSRLDKHAKLRVCYILHNSLPFSSGGYATRAHGIASGMRDLGLEVICLTRPGYPTEEKNINPSNISQTETIDDIQYVRILNPSRNKVKGIQYFTAAKQRYIDFFRLLRPNYIIAASNHLTSLPSQAAARYLSIPFFYEVRGFWEITRASREKGFEKTPEYRRQESLEAFAAINADHVFTLTNSMKSELMSRGVAAEKISIVPNAVNPSSFHPRPRDQYLSKQLGILGTTPVIGYIGSFVQYEGLEYLAAAGAKIAKRGLDFRLLIVGSENVSDSTKGTISEQISAIASENNISDKIIMPGRVPHHLVPSYYSLIDICPFPRKSQPVTEMVSPIKPLEAFSMEKAVIVSSVSALNEMVIHEQTGLIFQKDNVDDLADKLSLLIENPGLRLELGKRGRCWVLSHRTWKISAKIIVDRLNSFEAS